MERGAVAGIFATTLEAEIARAALEAAGIPADVEREPALGVGLLSGNPTGSVALIVPEERLAEAREILGRAVPAEPEAPPEDAWLEEHAADDGTSPCLACGAAIPEYLERCPACGWTYA